MYFAWKMKNIWVRPCQIIGELIALHSKGAFICMFAIDGKKIMVVIKRNILWVLHIMHVQPRLVAVHCLIDIKDFE